MTQEGINFLKTINEKQALKEQLEKQIEDLKQQVTNLDAEITTNKDGLFAEMSKEKLTEFYDEKSNLYANVFSKVSVGYTSDNEVIAKLKANGYANFVKVKTTEALDKNPLKKALKEDEALQKIINPLIVESTTSWVVVTTNENHQKMLEHIEENKKGK